MPLDARRGTVGNVLNTNDPTIMATPGPEVSPRQ